MFDSVNICEEAIGSRYVLIQFWNQDYSSLLNRVGWFDNLEGGVCLYLQHTSWAATVNGLIGTEAFSSLPARKIFCIFE